MRRTVALVFTFVVLTGSVAWSAPRTEDVTFHRDVLRCCRKIAKSAIAPERLLRCLF